MLFTVSVLDKGLPYSWQSQEFVLVEIQSSSGNLQTHSEPPAYSANEMHHLPLME